MSSPNPLNAIPVQDGDLEPYRTTANQYLKAVSGKVKPALLSPQKSGNGDPIYSREAAQAAAASDVEVSIMRFGYKVGRDDLVLAGGINCAITSIRKGMMLGFHLATLYTKAVSLDMLVQEKERAEGNKIAPERQAELSAKNNTASAIALFAAAYYTYTELSRYMPEKIETLIMELPPALPTLQYSAPKMALSSLILGWGVLLEKSGIVQNEIDFVKLSLLYMKKVLDEVAGRGPQLPYAEAFTNNTYVLNNSDFSITGFNCANANGVVRVEFKRIQPRQIVGNKLAKHQTRRTAQRLALYDPERKKNPILELPGVQGNLSMGFGPPGTGKTMMIGLLATETDEYCSRAGVPFFYLPWRKDMVSSLQGDSSGRALAWFRLLKDPSRVNLGVIDDAENFFKRRTDQNTSEGDRLIISVFLTETEGAESVDLGNTRLVLYTNIPDMIDDAVMSRIPTRFFIEGAKTWQDRVDQDYLWYSQFEKLDPHLVNLAKISGYEFLSAQSEVSSAGALMVNYRDAEQSVVRDILEKADELVFTELKTHGTKLSVEEARKTALYFGFLYREFSKQFPLFTSRDQRNIQAAVTERLTDFDVPEKWFDSHELFFGKSYEDRVTMLLELMKGTMSGISFAEVMREEAVRYFDNFVLIKDQGRERRIKELMENHNIAREATSRLTKEEKEG